MSNMVSSPFDQALSARLKGGEVEPPAHLWPNIELQLEKASRERSQRLLLVYKWGIAASMAVLVSALGFFYLRTNNEATTQLTAKDERPVTKDERPVTKNAAPPETKAKEHEENALTQATKQDVSDQPPLRFATRQKSTAPVQVMDSADYTVRKIKLGSVYVRTGDEKLPPLAYVTTPAITFTDRQPDPLSVLLGRLYDEERSEKAAEKPTENLWTSVGIAAGTFDPTYRSTSQINATVPASSGLYSNSTVSDRAPSPGASYAFGVSVGAMIAPRVTLTGGLTYLNQSATFTSSSVGIDASNQSYASLQDFNQTNSRYVAQGYQVNSNFQYLTLPVRAGWQLVQHKVGVQINGGVSTDFFMENTLSPDKPGIASTSYTARDNSIYRPVNFSGLFGTEFSYRVGKQYRLALSPGIRVPFGSMYRDGTTNLSPVTLDLGLHFRYIFH